MKDRRHFIALIIEFNYNQNDQLVEKFRAKDDRVVEVNSKASGADGDLQEKQLSPPRHPLVHSTANGNGNGNAK
ncbi:hypothetical protein KY290_008099 [Solanum tuberosum]|uniref:Uncharacterized protein n=1 Tax=Solanum tuberosum TaxID=4113 RepID=A0ABQ7W7I0_SOLTU|nr:hypothetical protein KY290_008099 [Solanum tuberosum]